MNHFICEQVEVSFIKPPLRQKTPVCPDGFSWNGNTYRVKELLSEWTDFTRRGRMARNMQPAHAEIASRRGSLGVGRFYYRVRVEEDRVFDLYYDRAVKNVDDRHGHWFLLREITDGEGDE